jgi:hypothetical protein
VKSCRAGSLNHTLHYAIHHRKYALVAHYWAIGDGARSDRYTLYQMNPVMNQTTTLAIQLSGVMSSEHQPSLSA